MALSADDLSKLWLTAVQGLPIDLSGVVLTEESADAFLVMQKEVEEAPAGVTADVPYEWSNPEQFKSLIESTYAAWGAPRPLVELQSASEAPSASTPIIPAGNGEPPVGI
jgi:hypothetical protein